MYTSNISTAMIILAVGPSRCTKVEIPGDEKSPVAVLVAENRIDCATPTGLVIRNGMKHITGMMEMSIRAIPACRIDRWRSHTQIRMSGIIKIAICFIERDIPIRT